MVLTSNDPDAESGVREDQPLLQPEDAVALWKPPKGFVWIQIGM